MGSYGYAACSHTDDQRLSEIIRPLETVKEIRARVEEAAVQAKQEIEALRNRIRESF